ncbi:Mitochondrial import inner membrane translocase subunit Tim17/Tim22/Tim23 family protein [Perilla frutescens var. frutescens]|nr:Mitochondrial import inner membrane translocase subunit Tim17/Tim22/Tim23 family protein [Perilla frutescens var. frutescens]
MASRQSKLSGIASFAPFYSVTEFEADKKHGGAREFVRVSREGKPDDLLNSAIGGFGSGAILGRLQAGPVGAARYSVMFAVVGTAVDYATSKIMPAIDKLKEEKDDWLKLPEWSPIKILDEEAVAAKRAREEQIYRSVHNMKKEES